MMMMMKDVAMATGLSTARPHSSALAVLVILLYGLKPTRVQKVATQSNHPFFYFSSDLLVTKIKQKLIKYSVKNARQMDTTLTCLQYNVIISS